MLFLSSTIMSAVALVKGIRKVVWGEPPESKEERRLLFKIDVFVLSFVCLNYWVNYLDRTNVANAYVSGMKLDLGMVKDQYNIVNTCFTVGYVVGMIPHNLILLKVPPRYWLAFCSFAWALLTLGMYKVTSYQQLCVIRFFQALFELLTFSGTHLILGSWYTEKELAKRAAIFTLSGLMGLLFLLFMQLAIYTNMDGKNGLAGWRWLFIIDFVITIPICIYGLVFFPDFPTLELLWLFTPEDRALARKRVKPVAHSKMDWSVIKRVVGNWHWWLFLALWVFGGENESYSTNSLFALWLAYEDYTVPQRNHYPMGIYGVGILATFVGALYIDGTGARYHWHVAVFIAGALIVLTIMLLARPMDTAVVYAAHYILGFSYAGQTAFFSWANVVCYQDLQERAVVLASMNMFLGAVNAWWSIVFYGADTVPKWRRGCYAMLGSTIASVLLAVAIRYLQLRDQRKMPADEEGVEVAHEIDSDSPSHESLAYQVNEKALAG